VQQQAGALDGTGLPSAHTRCATQQGVMQ